MKLAFFTNYSTGDIKIFLIVVVPDGKPVIGPVPGLSNIFFATGHEGGGLSMVISLFSWKLKWI